MAHELPRCPLFSIGIVTDSDPDESGEVEYGGEVEGIDAVILERVPSESATSENDDR